MDQPDQLLSDGLISLRALEPIDVDTLYKWENDSSIWSTGITFAPYSRKQLWDYINNYDGDIYTAKQLRLMIDLNRDGNAVTIGTIDLYDFDPVNARCAIGILIAPEFQHMGYGTIATKLIENYCHKRLSIHQLYSIVAETNIPSRCLFEKCGFKISGRLKSWLRTGNTYIDAYIYQNISLAQL